MRLRAVLRRSCKVQAVTPEEVKNLLIQADDTISQEHQGWRVLVHVHEPIEEL